MPAAAAQPAPVLSGQQAIGEARPGTACGKPADGRGKTVIALMCWRPSWMRTTQSRVAEVLNRKRGLSIDMIRRPHERFAISADVLIRPSRADKASWLA